MRRLLVTVVSLVLCLGSLGCGEQSGQTENKGQVIEDIVAAHPEHAKVAFENDQVKAVVFSLKPGDALPLHKGGPRAIYALSDYTIEWTEGGQVSEKSWSQGDVHWHDAVDHAIKNTGESDALYLVVSRKAAALPPTEGHDGSQDAAGADPPHAKVILENDHVRVVEVNLPPEAKQPTHHGAGRLAYSLAPYKISYTTDQGEAKISSHEAGDAHWHLPDAHAVENVGETPAHYLIFTFKR
jgi:quercetin dioxygenase-like cupin family protein